MTYSVMSFIFFSSLTYPRIFATTTQKIYSKDC